MSSFEGTHAGPLGEAARDWRLGRFAPLYAAGILAGIGLGFTVATWPTESPALGDHVAIVVPAGAPSNIDSAPVFVMPSEPVVELNATIAPYLPFDYHPELAALQEAPAPIAEPVPLAVAAAPVPASAPDPVAVPRPVAPAAPAAAAAPPSPAAAEKSDFYVPAVSAGPATALESNLLQLINTERAAAGLASYALEAGLTKIARTRSQQLVDQNYFAHRDPFGYSMYVELLRHFGYSSYAWAGENLAMNNWPSETAANEAIRGLMNSPTHRANILAGDFSRIGIGEITAADGRHFFTMIFLS